LQHAMWNRIAAITKALFELWAACQSDNEVEAFAALRYIKEAVGDLEGFYTYWHNGKEGEYRGRKSR
jgi:hypothetical protein